MELDRLEEAWRQGRHLIVRCGDGLTAREAAARVEAAGVPAEAPALVAAGLGTGRERLLYGSVEDLDRPALGTASVLIVLHPGALPFAFAWPPAAAP